LLHLALGLGLAAAPSMLAQAQEPAGLGAGTQKQSVRTDKDPLRARSATENVVFGQIVSTDEHRLTLREGEGDSVTETVYRLSPTVRVYSRDRVVDLSDLPASSRIRFTRSPEADGEISEIYAVEGTENTDAAARAAEETTDSTSAVGLGLILQDADGIVKIVGVRPDGPAAKAGIKAGDRIVRIDDGAISTPQEVFAVTDRMKDDQTVTLTVRRDDREHTMSLIADAGPGARDAIRTLTTAAPARVITDETAPVARNEVTPVVDLGAALETTPDGVAVVQVDTVSPLGDAGLKSGDFIKTAAGKSVVTPDALFRVLNEFDGGATVEVTAVRNGDEMDFKLTLPEEHKKVLVDRSEELDAPVRASVNTRMGRTGDSRTLQQIRRTQEQQQAQLKYLYDGMMQLARAANMNFGNSPYPFAGGVLPIGGLGGIGLGTGDGGFATIGYDANGNPVIGFNEAGIALGVMGYNDNGFPIIGETTLVTPVGANGSNGGSNVPNDQNGDGIPDQNQDLNQDGAPDVARPPEAPQQPGTFDDGDRASPVGNGGTPINPVLPPPGNKVFQPLSGGKNVPRTPATAPQPRTGN